MATGPTGINLANFASGAMATVEQAKQFGTTPGLTQTPSAPTDKKPSGLAYQARGAGTNFASDKYTVGSLQYPSDLMASNNIYGGNYAIFYINVQADSKLLKDTSYATVSDPSAIPPRQRGDAVALNTSAAGAIVGNAVFGGAFGSLAKAVGIESAGAGPGAGLGLAAGAAVATQAAGFSRATKRLKQVIALYMPEDLNIKYSMDWTEEETAMASAMYAGADNIASIFDSGRKSSIGQAALTAATTAALKTPGLGDYTSAQTGLATNPKKEQIFKGVKYRDFTLSYKFYPRSSDEANNINQIINAFKLHMHPEFKDAYNFLYIYPSEFDIYYYNNGQENLNLHRHTSVVLTDLDVAYTPQGVFTAFSDGMPTQINVSLSFRELALLTKDNILDGF
jgi:hypothetical protein